MGVPETAMHKYNLPPRNKYQIWLSRQILAVQPETETHPVDHASYSQLGKHPLAAYTAHVFTAVHGYNSAMMACS
jgi:hypothetical protein